MAFLNGYIVGAQKAGTTSLYDWLAQHPDVLAPEDAKDFPLFSGDCEGFADRLHRMRQLYAQESSEHRRLAIGAEANLVFSPRGIERLAVASPDCRIIFLIRQPDERCFSAWNYARERGLEDRTFAEAIAAELSGQSYPVDSYEGRQMNYLDHSRYVDQLEALKLSFQREHILVLPFESMCDAPERIMSLVCDFLQLEKGVTWDCRASNQTKGGSRSTILNKVLYQKRKTPLFSLLRSVTPATHRAKVRGWIVNWNRTKCNVKRIAPDPTVMMQLRTTLAADVNLHEQTVTHTRQYLRDHGLISTK